MNKQDKQDRILAATAWLIMAGTPVLILSTHAVFH